jgi:hypothetical protein
VADDLGMFVVFGSGRKLEAVRALGIGSCTNEDEFGTCVVKLQVLARKRRSSAAAEYATRSTTSHCVGGMISDFASSDPQPARTTAAVVFAAIVKPLVTSAGSDPGYAQHADNKPDRGCNRHPLQGRTPDRAGRGVPQRLGALLRGKCRITEMLARGRCRFGQRLFRHPGRLCDALARNVRRFGHTLLRVGE